MHVVRDVTNDGGDARHQPRDAAARSSTRWHNRIAKGIYG
jgi:hypothetical protein